MKIKKSFFSKEIEFSKEEIEYLTHNDVAGIQNRIINILLSTIDKLK